MNLAHPEHNHLHRTRAILFGCFLSILVLLPSAVAAQETVERPKIGLALSGGSSHGIAHIGVLKVMEEAGLRPDYITGVSMGSIIGGFYSLGYSADSLASILKSLDMDLVISNRIPENKIIFEEKSHFYNSIMSLPIRSTRVVLPSGMINGQQIENILSYYSWPAADIDDFAKLPIPFSCMAVDIITITKRELKSGYLPDALRASMAIPTVFTPLKTDSALLVDGGLLRNIAVTELRANGADIVIGSYTGFYLQNEEELQTAAGIVKQIGFLQSFRDFSSEKEKVDFLIEPQVKDLPSMEFDNPDTIIQRGYRAALPFREEFRKLADSLNMIAPQQPMMSILDRQFHTIDGIEITGNKITDAGQITGVLDIEPGQKVDKQKITDGIELLYGKAWFEKIKYRFVPRNDSLILVIECQERPKNMLYGSVHYDDALNVGLLMGFSTRNPITRRSVISIDTYIAEYYRYNFNITQFIGSNQKFGLSINLSGDRSLFPYLKMGGSGGKVFSTNFYNWFSISKRIGLNNMMILSAGIDNLYLAPDFTTECGISRLRYNYLSGTFEYMANTLDSKHFPDRGIVYAVSGSTSKLLSGSITSDSLTMNCTGENNAGFSFNRFYTLQGSFGHYFSVSKKTTIGMRGDLLFISNTDSISAHNNFYLLGGMVSSGNRSIAAAGFHPYEIAVRELAGFAMEADVEFLKDLHLTLTADAFAFRGTERDSDISFLAGYGIGIGYMSIIGPLKAGMMQGFYGQEAHFSNLKGYVSIGFSF